MPTAKEVDTRPMAVGKWPRHHQRQRGGGLYQRPPRPEAEVPQCRKSHDDEFCVQRVDSGCLDVLLRPELLHEIYGDRGYLSSSANPLLEFCLDGGYLKDQDEDDSPTESLPSLLEFCAQLHSGSATDDDNVNQIKMLERVCQTDCDINVQSSQGFTALHFLLNGCSKENFPTVLSSVEFLLRRGFDISAVDNEGNTPLLCLSKLLDRNLVTEATTLAKLFLCDARCDANHINSSDRSLLSYAVALGDATIDLTRLLLNHGARVLSLMPNNSDACDVARARDASAFTWLLRNVMRLQSLEQHSVTLRLLCDALAGDAEFMRTHVLSTMLHLGGQQAAASSSMAALIIELKNLLSPYWRQPRGLRDLCVICIRDAIGPKNLMRRSDELNLPASLISQVLLH